jgi:diguanylate cyclase (GGDEF)-like protein
VADRLQGVATRSNTGSTRRAGLKLVVVWPCLAAVIWLLLPAGHVAAWAALSSTLGGLSGLALLWVGRRHPALAARRLRTMAAGVLLAAAAASLVAGSGSTRSVSLGMAASGVGLLWLGYLAPAWLRQLWRRSDLIKFVTSEPAGMSGQEVDELAAWFLEQVARLLGGRGAFLADDADGVMATFRLDHAEIQSELAKLNDPGATGAASGIVAHRLQGAWLVVALSPLSPPVGPLESDMLVKLGSRANLVRGLKFLLEAERTGRAELADRERDLAESQELAHLGSWSWDFGTDQVLCSAEMCRILGRDSARPALDFSDFVGHFHPEDQVLLCRLCRAARDRGESFTVVLRIERPDGSVRHLKTRASVDSDPARAKVKAIGQDITEHKKAEDELAYSALHDILTGLPNRRLFMDRLQQALERRRRVPGQLAVMFLDLDRFKWINDSLGHSAGDHLLVAIARRLTAAARSSDTVARFGGDEFLVLCEDLRDESEAMAIAKRMLAAVSSPCALNGSETAPAASIGIVVTPVEGHQDAEALVREADIAMYQAKVGGRNRIAVFGPDLSVLAGKRLELETDLRRAVGAGQIEVHYQPEIDLVSGEVMGMEALVRWRHPRHGLIMPSEFISLAEETGLIVPLGKHVLLSACRQAAAMQGLVRDDFAVGVNMSARQLLEPELITDVRRILASTGLPARWLRLEITESVLLDDGNGIAKVLAELKDLGVHIAVDDFGTGYSSLTYLKRFPLDALKIDASFVRGVADDRHDSAIVASVIDLAHAFGLITTAEGIETAAQRDTLRRMGCARGQGFYWSKPLPADRVSAWMVPRSADRRGNGIGVGRPSVLVVDDDRLLRSLLRDLLSDTSGFQIHEAGDGREAVVLARCYQPDLILLDLAMPGMGGLDALPSIRAVAPTSRIVVLSALDDPEVADSATQAGAVGFFPKPDDLTGLPSFLDRLLDSALITT